jgi:hypothetical protein
MLLTHLRTVLVEIDVFSIADFPDRDLLSGNSKNDSIASGANSKTSGHCSGKWLSAAHVRPFRQTKNNPIDTRLNASWKFAVLLNRVGGQSHLHQRTIFRIDIYVNAVLFCFVVSGRAVHHF